MVSHSILLFFKNILYLEKEKENAQNESDLLVLMSRVSDVRSVF